MYWRLNFSLKSKALNVRQPKLFASYNKSVAEGGYHIFSSQLILSSVIFLWVFVCVCVCVCVCVLFIYTISISIICVSKDKHSLINRYIDSNRHIYDFYKWILEKK